MRCHGDGCRKIVTKGAISTEGDGYEEGGYSQPPNTMTSPNFQPYTIATTLLATTFTTTMKIRRMLILMSSCNEDGIDVTFAVRAPDVFSDLSKKDISCRRIFESISDLQDVSVS